MKRVGKIIIHPEHFALTLMVMLFSVITISSCSSSKVTTAEDGINNDGLNEKTKEVVPVIHLNAPREFKITEISPFPAGVHGITFDDEGVLYFSDTYAKLDDISKVYTLSPPYTGTPMPTEISGRSVAGLMWHHNKLYVALLNNDEIAIYDKDLEFLEARPVPSPWNFTTDGKNVYVVTHYGELGVLSNSRVRMYIKDLRSPFDIQYSGKESILLTEKSDSTNIFHLVEVKSDGEITQFSNLELKSPRGIESDLLGNIYLADMDAGKVYMISSDKTVSTVTDKYDNPICVTFGPDGNIFVTTSHNDGTLLKIVPGR